MNNILWNTNVQDKAIRRDIESGSEIHVMKYRAGFSGEVFFAYIENKIVMLPNGKVAKYDSAQAAYAAAFRIVCRSQVAA